ncbi:MAG: hypothetical protein JOY71_02800 [Acetobacteraceae bacterium]|nr:hypothetical protein [Acetobacteraceae bacterium]MBV8521055.1 hypothetical protein [Acetobacteraceae bacterium]
MRIFPAVALITLIIPAAAQAQASPEWLDRMATERNAAKAGNAALPPVQLPPTRPQPIIRPTEPLVCESAARPYLPIRRDPSLTSPIVGYTQPQVAVAGTAGNFVRIRLYNGKGYGYLPRDQVRPYASDINPNQTCAVAGTRPDTGALLFSYSR